MVILGQQEVWNECYKLIICPLPPFSNLFQVYDSDCCDSVLLELREYLPKYFGVWSPPTAPNGTVLILSVNLNLLEKSSGAWFLAVTSSVGFSPSDTAFQFAVLWLGLVFRAIPVCNALDGFGLWDHPCGPRVMGHGCSHGTFPN